MSFGVNLQGSRQQVEALAAEPAPPAVLTAVQPAALEALSAIILEAAGAGATEAACVAKRLVASDMVGHASHGVLRLRQYVDQIKKGQINVNTEPTVELDLPGIAVLDGGYGFGQVGADIATRLACTKATSQGIAMVTLRRSAHVGRLGDWVELAADQGCVSFHFVNTLAAPMVAAWGGRERRLSTNPLAWGMPVQDGPPIVVDMTTSVVAEGKVRLAKAGGQRIPLGWVVDSAGLDSSDPNALYAGGALRALGGLDAGHKGYALSLMVDLMAGALSGGGASGPDQSVNTNNFTVIAISPAAMGKGFEIASEAERFSNWLRSSTPVDPTHPVLLPGDVERAQRGRHLVSGLTISEGLMQALQETSQSVGLPPDTVQRTLNR